MVWASGGILGNRISAAGAALDSTGFTIATGDQVLPAVASNGSDYFVAWEDPDGTAGADVHGVEVSAAGVTMGGALAVSATARDEGSPGLAFNAASGGYLVAYDSSYRIRARLVGGTIAPMPVDAGMPDAPVMGDAGAMDAGTMDAGAMIDAGTAADAAVTPDAPADDAPTTPDGGCGGCSTSSPPSSLAGLALLLALLVRRRGHQGAR